MKDIKEKIQQNNAKMKQIQDMFEKLTKNARTGTGSEIFAEQRFDKDNLFSGRLHKIDSG